MGEQIRNPVYQGREQGSQSVPGFEVPTGTPVEGRLEAARGTFVGRSSSSPFGQGTPAMAVSARGNPKGNPTITSRVLARYVEGALKRAKQALVVFGEKLKNTIGPGIFVVYSKPPAEPVPA